MTRPTSLGQTSPSTAELGPFLNSGLIARRSNVSTRKSGRNLRAHDERQRTVPRRSEDLDFADKTIRSLTSGYSNRALRRSLEMANDTENSNRYRRLTGDRRGTRGSVLETWL